jgi:hypothetical protein
MVRFYAFWLNSSNPALWAWRSTLPAEASGAWIGEGMGERTPL